MNDKLSALTLNFSIKIINLSENIKGHSSIANQPERSATSIGANLREARYAHSKADFVAKLQISLKECYETEYWLEIIQKAALAPIEKVSQLLHESGSIRRLLISSINTVKSKL